MIALTAYGDETGTHDESPIMMLAGYVSRSDKWNHFGPKWRRAALKAGLPGYFHATEHWKTAAGLAFAPDAQRLVERYILFGYVIELDKTSYEQHYIAGNRIKKPQLDTRYSLCFRFLLAFLVTRLPTLLGHDDLTIDIVLEKGAAGANDSHRIVQQLRKQPETHGIVRMLGNLSFEPKEKWPGLQASDTLAFGSGKIVPNNPEMIDIPQDGPLVHSQMATKYKPPVFRCLLGASELGALKSDLLTLVEIRRRIADEAFAARSPTNSG